MVTKLRSNGSRPAGVELSPLDPAAISQMVETQDAQTADLRLRMESDYGLYLLEAPPQEEGYTKFTSNEPQVFADKILSWLANANLVIRFPLGQKPREHRERDDRKEQFIQGLLKWVDENLADLALPGLREQLSFFIVLRGLFAGRALFIKTGDGTTKLEVMPWDPLYTYWGMGKDGLVWACYKMRRTGLELRDEYGVDLGDNDEGYEVLDYYNRYQNALIHEGRCLVAPQMHYAGRVPVFLGAVASAPPIMRRDSVDRAGPTKHYGESIYKPLRNTYRTFNETMGYYATLVRLSVEQGLILYSPTGAKKLKGGDPRRAHTVLSLATTDKLVEMPMMEMSREAGAFVGQVSGEMQRGSLSHTSYGDLQFAISGIALSLLRQGNDAAIQPRVKALENAYSQIIRMLCQQYATGGFAPVDLRGSTQRKGWFADSYSEVDAQDSQRRPLAPVIKIVPVLPQDDAAKFAMAQMARGGKTPLLPHREILDKVLEYQNVDAVLDMIKEEQGEQLSPLAALATLIEALKKQERWDLAGYYERDLERMMQEQQAAPPAPPTGGLGKAPVGPPGLAPSVLPGAMMGMPPPVPVPQGELPLRPPGAPRPGALSEQGRLARMGMVPGR